MKSLSVLNNLRKVNRKKSDDYFRSHYRNNKNKFKASNRNVITLDSTKFITSEKTDLVVLDDE